MNKTTGIALLPLLVFILFFNNTSEINAQVLWDKTSYGMTIHEVRSLYPEAEMLYIRHFIQIETSVETGLFNWALTSYEAKSMLKLTNIETEGHIFDATFFFSVNEEKLSQVTLSYRNDISGYEEGNSIYDALYAIFTERYGEATSLYPIPRNATWYHNEETTILLFFNYVLAEIDGFSVGIIYRKKYY
jgi:hypothetical protein